MRKVLGVLVLACGARAIPATVADACYELAHVACAKDTTCETGTGGVACINTFQTECCSFHNCAEPVADCAAGLRECAGGPNGTTVFSAHVFWNCEDAIQTETCGEWAGGLVPNACLRDAGR